MMMNQEILNNIYRQIKTDYKYGIVLKGQPGEAVDCPAVFRFNNDWLMTYLIFNGKGYETGLAYSKNLLEWHPLVRILTFSPGNWDARQAGGSIALQEHQWGGSYRLRRFDGKCWLSYLGGAGEGYETEPLSIGLAWTTTPQRPIEWQRCPENPVLHIHQPDVRPFERKTLYRSHILWDQHKTTGHPFVMYYNGKQEGEWIERIGMAVSDDMIHWQRYGREPVIDHGRGISGDPQITRIGNIWVMFYFGYLWQPRAFDTFACSEDLVNWTKWQGPHLVEPSEPWDEKYAHKPWIIKSNEVVYHFYCAVGKQGRVIALATSKKCGHSPLND